MFKIIKKMSYKGDFEPAELLDPSTCTYVSLTPEIRQLIAKEDIQTARLAQKQVQIIEDINFGETDMKKLIEKKVQFWNEDSTIKLSQINPIIKTKVLKIMDEIVQAMGKKTAFQFKYMFLSLIHI
eukprot:TRINITY_DN3304_c0_g1_i2.p3 TRINITY_DN3304_c0_g1~~TRINITY_DN3304_c0_g1_i2.p3  ORF type:complete len:126 (+),score=27.34 TRINITY_DN3304_c0_g1_i2:457-834(+)